MRTTRQVHAGWIRTSGDGSKETAIRPRRTLLRASPSSERQRCLHPVVHPLNVRDRLRGNNTLYDRRVSIMSECFELFVEMSSENRLVNLLHVSCCSRQCCAEIQDAEDDRVIHTSGDQKTEHEDAADFFTEGLFV